MKQIVAVTSLSIALAVAASCAVSAAVDMGWKPAYQVVRIGDPVSVRLYASSSTPAPTLIAAMDVVVTYDPSRLHFYNMIPDGGGYQWLEAGFRSPSPDDINESIDDGTFMYTAWGQLGLAATAPKSGLQVATFKFTAVAPSCSSEISIPAMLGSAKTVVYDGVVPNYPVTGRLDTALVKVVPPGVLTSVGQAKAIADGNMVQLGGPIVTKTYGTYFYMEDFGRASGIRVNCDPGRLPAEGSTPIVTGTIRTVNGERQVTASDVATGCLAPIPGSFAMNCRAAKSTLSPVGLLVKVFGRVDAVDPSGNWFTVVDGADHPLRVELHDASAPSQGVSVAVTGVLGADESGPILRINKTLDITSY